MVTVLKKYSGYGLIAFMMLLLFRAVFLNSGDYLILPALAGLLFLLFLLLTDYTKILFLLILLIPLSVPFPLTENLVLVFPSEVLIALLALYTGIQYLFFRPIDKTILFHPVSVLLLLDIAWNLIGSLTSDLPEVSLKRTLVGAAYILVYYFLLIPLLETTAMVLNVYKWYSFGLILPILYTLYIHAGSGFMLSYSPLVSRPFYNDHTIYGAALAFFIPCLLYLAVKKQARPAHTFGYALLALLFLIALFFSYSRAAWLSLSLAGLLFVFMLIQHKIVLTFVVLITVSLSVFFSWDTIYESTLDSRAISNKDITEHVQSVTNVNSDVSNAERINRWKSALRMFEEKPLAGFGPGTYQFYYGNYQVRTDMTRISTFHGNKGHAHSEYLNRLSETGAPGLLLFIVTALVVFATAWRIDQRTSEVAVKNIIRISVLGLFTFYVHSFFNGFTDTDKIAMPVYAAMAVVVGMEVRGRRIFGNDNSKCEI